MGFSPAFIDLYFYLKKKKQSQEAKRPEFGRDLWGFSTNYWPMSWKPPYRSEDSTDKARQLIITEILNGNEKVRSQAAGDIVD